MPFSCLLVGPPGEGKTTAACTAPGPILVADFDNKLHKMENLKHRLRTKENPTGDIIQVAMDYPLSEMGLRRLATDKNEMGTKQVITPQPKGYLKFVELVEGLQKNNYVYKEVGFPDVLIASFVLDSYTTMQEHLKRLITSSNERTAMSLPLYGVLLANLEEVNNTLIRFPINVLILAHQKVDKDELTGKIRYKIFCEGQMSDKIGKEFEEIYYMQKTIVGSGAGATAKYEMMTIGDGMRECRTSRKLGALVEPDFCKIYGIKKA